MKVLYLLLFFSIQYSYLHAQKITISGYIKDNESGENLIGAAVIDKISGAGVVSNTYGFFSLSLNQGDSVNLFCTYVGYQAQNIQLIASEDKIIHFSLSGDTMLEEIEVVAEQYSEPIEQSTQMSAISIPVKQIKLLPALTIC